MNLLIPRTRPITLADGDPQEHVPPDRLGIACSGFPRTRADPPRGTHTVAVHGRERSAAPTASVASGRVISLVPEVTLRQHSIAVRIELIESTVEERCDLRLLDAAIIVPVELPSE